MKNGTNGMSEARWEEVLAATAKMQEEARARWQVVLDRMADAAAKHEGLTKVERDIYRAAISTTPNGGAMHEDGMEAVEDARAQWKQADRKIYGGP